MTTNNKKRINILDFIVLLVVIAVVLLGAYALFGRDGAQSQTVSSNVTFTLEATKQQKDILQYIQEGQTVYDSTNKTELGKVVAIYETPARVLVEDHNRQTIEYTQVPEKIDLVLEVEAKAKVQPPNILVDTVALKIGKQVHCMVGNAAFTTTIIGIESDESLLIKKEETK